MLQLALCGARYILGITNYELILIGCITYIQLTLLIFLSIHFFRFSTKESAAHAIVAIHNSDVNGHTVKCSWGKESGDPNNLPANSQVCKSLHDSC